MSKYFFVTLFCVLFSLHYTNAYSIYDTTIKPADVDTGAYFPLLRHKKVALIINQTSQVGNTSLLDLLVANNIQVVKIFVPEHGFRGSEDAGAKIGDSVDPRTGLLILSLYGNHKKPTQQELQDIDIVVYDLQDVGARFYTYISTLQYCMQACAENSKAFLILDRPDPNGFYVDGPVLENANRSFVGMQPIPIVYGMTVGEYALMLRGEWWFEHAEALDLAVIKCKNYTHSKKYFVPIAPSPNLQTMAAIYAYPSLCLFEGTKISVGRGTEAPFQMYGSPDLLGKTYHFTFTPQASYGAKSPLYVGKLCYGDTIISNTEKLLRNLNRSINIDWMLRTYKAYPKKDSFFSAFFTKLSGTTKLEQFIKKGAKEREIRTSWQKDIIAFKKIRKKYLLYKDFE